MLVKVKDGYVVMNHYHHSVGDGTSGKLTRPNTRVHQSRMGGQGQVRSLFGVNSHCVMDGRRDGRMDRQSDLYSRVYATKN